MIRETLMFPSLCKEERRGGRDTVELEILIHCTIERTTKKGPQILLRALIIYWPPETGKHYLREFKS